MENIFTDTFKSQYQRFKYAVNHIYLLVNRKFNKKKKERNIFNQIYELSCRKGKRKVCTGITRNTKIWSGQPVPIDMGTTEGVLNNNTW